MALTIVAIACVTDLRTRRIPNSLTLGGAALAFLYFTFAGGASVFSEAWQDGLSDWRSSCRYSFWEASELATSS